MCVVGIVEKPGFLKAQLLGANSVTVHGAERKGALKHLNMGHSCPIELAEDQNENCHNER